MSNKRVFYITTAIPYVNGDPHLGHALEFVQADVLARHRRLRGDNVRFLSGTDDNALKNVDAAVAAGLSVAEFVAEKAQRFVDLSVPLQLSNDDFIRTSTDPRHRPGVERLWQACANAGDLYQRDYEGLYCLGWEAFVLPDDLADGRCPEHGEAPELIVERNWFFRLSRYQEALLSVIESGRLRIEPEHRRNEVLAFTRNGLTDFSVSRAQERARGWGIPVPDDPEQVIYVWFDALANYITALGNGSDGAYREWWHESDQRLHLIGKGIIRFHAIYWPAILLSARQPLPTTIFVHDYLTFNGQKLSKSLVTAIDPLSVVERYGADALRWWFLRDVPRNGDADFREALIAVRANELADDLGNLINRTIALVSRNRPEGVHQTSDWPVEASVLRARCTALPNAIDKALAAFDLRAATTALWEVVAEANRFVSATQPWDIAKAAHRGDSQASERLDAVLAALFDACRVIAHELRPFLPLAAARIVALCGDIGALRPAVVTRGKGSDGPSDAEGRVGMHKLDLHAAASYSWTSPPSRSRSGSGSAAAGRGRRGPSAGCAPAGMRSRRWSATRTKPGRPPFGDASAGPEVGAVAMISNGDFAMNATERSSSCSRSLAMALSEGHPI